MARPRAFDADKTLDAALRLFWERGYCGASVDDLVQATGVARGSLYAAFGDKERLFLAALELYEARFGGPMVSAATAPGLSGRDAVAALLAARIEALSDPTTPAGCFGVNTLADGAAPAKARERLFRSINGQFTFIKQLVGRDVTVELETDKLAWFYVGVIQGLGTLARAGADARALTSMAEAAVCLLELDRR